MSQIEIALSAIRARVASFMKAPPPVATIARTAGQHARHHTALAVAEMLFAVAGENVGDRHARRLDDFLVDIDEWQPEPQREAPPDGGLARAHHANEDDGAPVQGLDKRHRPIIAPAARLGGGRLCLWLACKSRA